MKEPLRPTALIMDETELHLRLPVRKADDARMIQSALGWPIMRVM